MAAAVASIGRSDAQPTFLKCAPAARLVAMREEKVEHDGSQRPAKRQRRTTGPYTPMAAPQASVISEPVLMEEDRLSPELSGDLSPPAIKMEGKVDATCRVVATETNLDHVDDGFK